MKKGGTSQETRRASFWLLLLSVAVFSYGLGVVTYGLVMVDGQDSDQLTILLTGLILAASASVFILQYTAARRREARLAQSQTRARQDRQALLTTINSASQAIFTVQKSGKIGLYNAAFLALLDTNKNITAASIDSVLPVEDESGKKIRLSQLLKSVDRHETEDLWLSTGGDDRLRLHLSLSRVATGYGDAQNRDVFVCTARDITKQKSLEEERDEFISVVSHELRTPITIAEGSLDNALVLFDKPGVSQDVLRKNVDLAHAQVIFLSGMINDLSTLSRAERGVGDDLETIDLKELVQKLKDEYAPQAAVKKLQFNLRADANLTTITSSRLYLEELLQNFITNAIKYTEEGSVTLSVSQTADHVDFAVKDSGIGIAKADLKRIFDKFYRAEDFRTRETSGTGLGLYVAAKLARKLGVKIDVTSRLNHGSTFSIRVPRDSA